MTDYTSKVGPSADMSVTALLQETNQELPGWLGSLAQRGGGFGGGGGGKRRGGNANRFGGRDFRKDGGYSGGGGRQGGYSGAQQYGSAYGGVCRFSLPFVGLPCASIVLLLLNLCEIHTSLRKTSQLLWSFSWQAAATAAGNSLTATAAAAAGGTAHRAHGINSVTFQLAAAQCCRLRPRGPGQQKQGAAAQ